MDRQIVCFAIPTFQVALARQVDTALRERPVAVALSLTPRSLITEVSREAREEGIHVGMPVTQARHRCPALQVLPPDPTRLSQADRAIGTLVDRFAPVRESVQPGHLFLDLTGTNRLFGPARDTAMRIERAVIQQCGLAGVAGVGSSKLVSRIASTLLDPLQVWDVRCGSEEAFLAPLSIHALPLGPSSDKTVMALLDDVNLQTLGELAAIDVAHLQLVLGRDASLVHSWARGIDSSPVFPRVKQPCVEATVSCDPDDIDIDRLEGRLDDLLERICRELRRQRRVCHKLTFDMTTRDARHVTRSHAIHPGTFWEVDLTPSLYPLLRQATQRRVRIRTLTVRAEELAPLIEQPTLFDNVGEDHFCAFSQKDLSVRKRQLALAMDQIRARFGVQSIRWGKTHAIVCSS
jgi:DNA polymerase-4